VKRSSGLRRVTVACGVLSAFSNISVAWHMASLEAPGGLITLCLGFAGIKLAGSAAYAYQLTRPVAS
jgi:hypothetical protein